MLCMGRARPALVKPKVCLQQNSGRFSSTSGRALGSIEALWLRLGAGAVPIVKL